MLLLLLVAVSARAQIEHGKVYNFVNIANTGKSMVWVSGDQLSIADTDESDNKQLWYVVKNEDNSYSLRNLDNGKYLRSPNATGNARWTTVENVDDNCKFECVVAGSGHSLRATNSTGGEHEKHYMHYSSANGGVDRIVCWSTTEPSQWTINKMDISEKELDYMFASEYKDAYQNILSTLFTDYSCSELKSQYASYSESQMQADANYQRLSATLQKMVVKVLSGNWDEANYDVNKSAWDSEYAKKYRVQLYEPYNEPEAAAKAIGINAHTNMNNPTGIFSDAHEVLYIMVEGTIKEGASLYLASITGHNRLEGYDEGILLNEGLNIIPTEAAGNNYFINYVVHTFDTSNGKRGKAAKARGLSGFPDLKIHIEGGYINGYWNKMGDDLYTADTNDSWNYIEQRATQTDVTVLGEYMTLQFPLRDEDTEQYVDKEDGNKVKWNKGLGSYLNELVDIEDVINSWDNVMMWERFLLGLLSEKTTLDVAKNPKSPYSSQANVVGYIGDETDGGYADYYNVHGLALGVGGNSYMYGSWDHCGYNFNTMESIIKDIPNNVGSHWGPAHEIGHQHQSLITMRGETEVSNNLFSNVVLWYFGKTTSRVNGDNGSLENVLKNFNKEDGNYLTNNIWGMTHMYYKLFLYYHVLGHNPKFYPRLFEMLRQDPIEGMGGTVDGAKAQLHLYKMVCRAAEEDLTEFFRAHGFFTPLDGFLMGDYGESTYYMTQEQIDAAIAEVKANNWNENIAVLFINDATPDGAITSHKGGQLSLYDRDGDDLDKDGDKDEPYPFPLAEMGGYATFEQSVTDGAELQYTVSGKNVTVNAGGGVGYAIYNKEGELIAFSNKKTFTVSDECATALMWGNATMKVVNADNTTVEVEVDDAVASKHELLGNLIAEVEAELQYDDPTRVGYYIAGALDNLRTICEDAKIVYDNQDVKSYAAAYTKLSEEFYAVTHDAYNHVTMMAGTYRLNSRSNTDYWMSVNADNKAIGESSNTSSTKQEWVFEATGAEGIFYIKNANTSRYLTTAVKSTQMVTTDNKAEAKGYKVDLVETGVMTLQCQDGDKQFLNRNGSTVLGWGDGNDHNSQWYITTVSVEQTAGKLHELNTLVNKTKELIDEMAEVTPTQKQTLLQTTSPSSPFYLSTNACHNTVNNASDGQGLAGLLDENVATYFHSDWYGTVKDTHYLQVDMGAYNLSDLVFYYTTRDNGDNCPTTIEVWGSTDGTTFNDKLYTFTGLPTDGAKTWESPMLSKAKDYSSLRFMVTAAEGGKKFFVMSRFGFVKCEATVESKGEEYVAKGLTDDALISAYASIHKAQEKIMVGGATLDELTSLYDELSPKYAALEVIYNKAKNFAFNTRMAELKDWKERLSILIKQCGTVTYNPATPDTELALQADNSANSWYVSSNADHNTGTADPDGGGIFALVDDDYNTYFHTRWGGGEISEPHYIQVDMGQGKTIQEFVFSYTPRSGSPAPTAMKIYGSNDASSNDETSFTEVLATITSGLPAHDSGKSYTSSTINSSGAAYRYLRFVVTGSEGPGNAQYGGQYFFGMMEFDITEMAKPESYTVTLGNGAGDDVTEELLLTAYKAVQEAQSVVDYANTESQVQKAIEKLQAQYQALEDAKNSVVYVKYTISTNVAGGGVIYEEQPYTTTLTAPNTLKVDDLDGAVEVEGYVVRSMSIEGASIIVAYNKMFTVQIVGGEGQGSVTFGGTEYFDGDEFDVEGDFTDDALTVTSVEGYVYDLGVDHITGEIIVIYTVDKSDWSSLVGEVETLINSCYTDGVLNYVNSDFINEDKMTEVRNAIVDAQTQCDNATTLGEYNAAKEALNQAKSTLEMAKASAEAEVIARNEKREALRVLIGRTTDLINLCEEKPGDATTALINEVSVAVTLAQSVVDNQGSTEDELNSTIDDLQAEYNVLAAAQQSTAKAELRAWIAQTEDLLAECGAYSYDKQMIEKPVDLQVNDVDVAYYLSTNADQNVVDENKQDGGGIGALIDGTVDTYMHTQWSGTPVGDDHYIQVKLGNGKGLAEFTFTYATRKGINADNTSPAPTIIELYGSNDGKTFTDKPIARFTASDENNPLISYTKLGEYWTSGKVELGQSYDYLRFYVRESNGPGNKQYGGHFFFAMSEFALNSISYDESNYVYYLESLTSYGTVTEEQFLNVAKAKDDAVALANSSYDKDELEGATATLQEYYNALLAAHNDYSYLPVTLTTDVENPVLYVMNSKRGAGKVLQYNAGDNDFTIVDAAEVNVNHLFYFTKGTKKGQVYVHPFTAEGQVLAAIDKTNGADKVFVAEKEVASAMQWTFEQETIDETVWYSLKGVGAPYFSHHGGGANKMGFYGLKDEGSRFTLTTMMYHTAKIGQYLHTSLYLDYPTIIPEGVKAYIAKNPSEEGTIDLVKLQGSVLPANTGVILYSETPDTYYFLYTDAEATDNVSENLLKGSASEQYVGDETGAKKYYIFGRKNDNVGLYWARMDYTADGTYVGNDKGTHFKASANKVYLELDASQPALSGFRFRVGGDETGIEGITIDADATIYNLYGRRVLEVVTPGLYIINGEKRYINIK